MIPFFGPFVSWMPPVLVALIMPNAPVVPGADPDGHRAGS